MKISILGSGPITNALARALGRNSMVKLYTERTTWIDGVEVLKYQSFISQAIDSDILILAWRGLPEQGSEKEVVLEHLAQNSPVNALILNLSSVAVYGENSDINFETVVPKPINSYGHAKYNLECYLNTYAIPKVCNLRISNVFGDPEFTDIVNKILNANKRPTNLITPEATSRDFISQKSLISSISNLIKTSHRIPRREVFNISTGNSLTLMELKNLIESTLNLEILWAPIPQDSMVIQVSMVSNLKLRTFLDIKFTSDNEELISYIKDFHHRSARSHGHV